MSSSDSIKKVVGSDFYKSIKCASDIFGTLSSAYSAGISVLTYLGVLEGPENDFEKLHKTLEEIQQKLDNLLKNLEMDRLEQAHIATGITRTTIINDASNVKSAAYNAYWYMKVPSSDNTNQFFETRDDAQLSVNHFVENPQYWRRPYLDFVDYNDIWSGPIHPPTEEGGIWVWDFIITLPAQLEAIANWSIIIFASDTGFQQAHFFRGSEIISHINKLHDAMVNILRSFQPIRPPSEFEMRYLVFAINDANFFFFHLEFFRIHPPMSSEQKETMFNNILEAFVPGGRWRLSEYRCGVVEKYSGWACFDTYPVSEIANGANYLTLPDSLEGIKWDTHPGTPSLLFLFTHPKFIQLPTISINQPEEYQKFYDRFILRHTLRSWKQGKVLAQELGLSDVRKAICHLCAMRKIQPPELPSEWNKYVVSSLRELWSIVPDSMRGTSEQRKSISMRNMGIILGIEAPITMRRMFFLDE